MLMDFNVIYKSINVTRARTNKNCNKSSDGRLWVKLCTSFFGFDRGLFLCLAYVSPEALCHPASRDNT